MKVLDNGQVEAVWRTPQEARELKRQIKALRQNLKLRLQAIAIEKRGLLAEYREAKSKSGPSPFPYSRGSLSQFIRIVQYTSKAQAASHYEPLILSVEQKRSIAETIDTNLQHLLLQLDDWLAGYL